MPKTQLQNQDALQTPLYKATKRLHALEKIWNSKQDEDRRKQACKRLEYYRGNSTKYIPSMPSEPDWHKAAKPHFNPGLTKKAVDTLSYLYSDEPQRTVGEGQEDAWKQSLWDFGSGLTNTLKKADGKIRLLGQVGLLIHYTPNPDLPRDQWPAVHDPAEAGADLEIITPDRCAVLPNAWNSRFADAVIYKIGKIRIYDNQAQKYVTKSLFGYWDNQVYMAVVNKGAAGIASFKPVESPGPAGELGLVHPHPYGTIPIAWLREEDPDPDSFWAPMWGGPDLLSNLTSVAQLWTEYLWTSMLQRGQPYSTGDAKVEGSLAPDSILKITGEGVNFGIASNGANLSGIQKALETTLEVLANVMGLPSRSFKIDDTAYRSGVAIHLSRAELADDRNARINKAQKWEKDIHTLAERVLEPHKGSATPSGYVSTSYPDIDDETPDQLLNRVKSEVQDLGIMSLVEARLALHPGETREAAEAAVREAQGQEAEADVVDDPTPPPNLRASTQEEEPMVNPEQDEE